MKNVAHDLQTDGRLVTSKRKFSETRARCSSLKVASEPKTTEKHSSAYLWLEHGLLAASYSQD